MPWLAWTVFFFLVSLGCFIYGLTLGGDSLAQRLAPPLIYWSVVALWAYAFTCVISFYQHLSLQPPPSPPRTQWRGLSVRESAQEAELVELVVCASGQKVFPHSIWHDGTEDGSGAAKPRWASLKVR